jgi:tetratricopeptide (TPR) repeat protein
MQAAAELMPVWEANKKHPGAAHYLIHSFDDPVHAPLGLPMAKAYADIAPAAAHAQHMTSHIFLALGMWDGVIDANLIARDVQTSRQQELNEQTTVCGHYPWWLQYGYLQEGQSDQAEQVLEKCYERVEGSPSSSEKWHFSVMKAHQIVDTENWKKIDTWTSNYQPDTNGSRNYFFTNGYAAIKNGNTERAKEFLNKLEQTQQNPERDIQIKQLEGLLQIGKDNTEASIEILKEAVAAEFELPIDFGPPTIVKPSAELLADVYMALGNQELAKEYYQIQLQRTPKRRLSQLGLKDAN